MSRLAFGEGTTRRRVTAVNESTSRRAAHRHYAPRGLLHRKHPTANGIAERLCSHLLRLSTGQLVADIVTVYGVAESTAMAAVGLARGFARHHSAADVQP
jgi:hypothetical protein